MKNNKLSIILSSVFVMTVLISGGAYYSIWKWQSQGLATKDSGLVPASAETEDGTKTVNASVMQVDNLSDEQIQKDLSDSAKASLANFYASFKDKDSERLSQLFTPNTTDENKNYFSSIFTDKDSKGNASNITLFKANLASEVATNYSVVSVEAKDAGWSIKIQEKRTDKAGKALPADTSTFINLVPGTESSFPWLIDSYQKTGIAGKFSGFLTN